MDDHSLPTFALTVGAEAAGDLADATVHVSTDTVPPVDSEVAVELTMPDRAPLLLTGRVADIEIDQSSGESRPVGMDVRLVNLPADVLLQLARWLSESGDDAETPAHLEKHLGETEEQINQLQRELESLAEEDRTSRILVERLTQERSALQARVDDANPELLELRGRRSELEAALRDAVEGPDTRRGLLEAELTAARERADAAEQLVEEVKQELEREQGEAEATVAAAESERDEQRTRAETDHDARAKQLDEAHKAAAALEAQIAEIDATTELVRSGGLEDAEALSARLQSEQRAFAQERERAVRLERELADARETYEKLRAKRRDHNRLLSMMAEEGQVDSQNLDLDDDDLDRLDDAFSDLDGPSPTADDQPETAAPLPEPDLDDASQPQPSATEAAPPEPIPPEPIPPEPIPPEAVSEPAAIGPMNEPVAELNATTTADVGSPEPTTDGGAMLYVPAEQPADVAPPPARKPSIGLIVAIVAAVAILAVAITELVMDGALIIRPLFGTNVSAVEPVEIVTPEPTDTDATAPTVTDDEGEPSSEARATEVAEAVTADEEPTETDEEPTETDEEPAEETGEMDLDAAVEEARTLYKKGRGRAAVELLKANIEKQPEHAPSLALLGQIYVEQDRPGPAVVHLKRALVLSPRTAPTVKTLADAYRALGKPAKAKPLYERYLRMAPRGRFAADVQTILEKLEEPAPE